MLVHQIIAAYQQIVLRAHAQGIRVIGGMVTPYGGSDYYHPATASEADRQATNTWIRQPGHFDAVVDFDRLVRDPKHPDRMLPRYDSGDHLHPSRPAPGRATRGCDEPGGGGTGQIGGRAVPWRTIFGPQVARTAMPARRRACTRLR